MASGSVVADGDRNLTEDLHRKNEVCIVYTRKNRRKAPANSNSDAAGAAERSVGVESARAEPTAASSPARSRVSCDEVVVRPASEGIPVGQDGKFTEEPPVAADSKNEYFHDTERGPEESRGGEEALTDGGAEPLHGEVGSREEPQVSACEIAQPELEPTGGERRCLDSGKEINSNNWEETNGERQSVATGRDEQLCGSHTERLNNGKELQPSSAHSDQGDELNDTGDETVLPNGRGEPQISYGQVTMPIGGAGLLASGFERHPNGVAPVFSVNGVLKPVISRVGDRVKVPLSESNSKAELRGLKRKFENELDQVRSLAKRLEAKELQIVAINSGNTTSRSTYISSGEGNSGFYNQPQLIRVNSVVGSGGHPETRPFRHLNVSVMENNHGVGEYVEKEKRTPKANKFYRNSEFLLGKDRLPPESNKKAKPNRAGKKHGVAVEHGFGFGFGFGSGADKNRDKVFRSCSNLLQRLMNHKHGWVFNSPVDAEKLGLSDYHDIIKYPMDFGTIKTRLSQNWYRSARQFAEDVRLVFRNAMTYNPKGQDVHTMAEELSEIFEDKWASIEKEYFPYQMHYDAGFPTPRKPHPLPPPIPAPLSIPTPSRSAPPMRTLDLSESVTMPSNPRPRPANMDTPHTSRTPVPKKPKAKDPHKRDMTYEEKQKLSTNLQSLPSEKLDAVVQIINRRNSGLSQHNDEIEVDIDSVEAETLWELDRFVTNYKKSLSKYKRKAELAEQARVEAAQSVLATNPAPASLNSQKEGPPGGNINPAPVQVGIQGDNATPSSSSSSSSSDSGSSSSDSDSDSSSAESDAGQSPRT